MAYNNKQEDYDLLIAVGFIVVLAIVLIVLGNYL